MAQDEEGVSRAQLIAGNVEKAHMSLHLQIIECFKFCVGPVLETDQASSASSVHR